MFKIVETNKQCSEYVGKQEGMRVKMTKDGMKITILFRNPTQTEMREIEEASIDFSLVQKNKGLFLLSKFGKLNWIDCIVRHEEGVALWNLVPMLGKKNHGYKCNIELYDTNRGRLRAFRTVGIGFEMSMKIRDYFMYNPLLSGEGQKKAITDTYKTYSTEELLKHSIVTYNIKPKYTKKYAGHEEPYIDRIYKKVRENWLRYMESDGIGKRYSLEEFYAEMQSDYGDRQRAIDLIEARVPSTLTVANMFEGGITNYFIISDIGNGVICEKCNSIGGVVLLLDENLTSNLNNKIFVPSMETYCNLAIEPESDELLRYPPVPTNANTDYWYCPYCNEMHKISDYKKTREVYDQEVVNVNVDMSKHLKKDKDLEMLEEIVSGKRWF
ncbi:MAG TPA: hypothetical protein GX707_15015 [Epulopiscium sp.]|nr:hypothetical protein [Candidatus Epulonipiscium sp.]